MSNFNNGTLVWYFKSGIQAPVECVYIGAVKVDKGASTNKHIIRFVDNTQTVHVSTDELYRTGDAAWEALTEGAKSSIHDLEIIIEVYKQLTKGGK